MATNFTGNYQIKLIGTGLEAGTWGSSTNENLKRIEQALGSAVSINVLSPPSGSTPAAAGGGTPLIWITADTADAGDDGSEGRAAFVEFEGAVTGDITVEIRGASGSDIPNRVYLVWNHLTDSAAEGNLYSLILDASGVDARDLTIKNGAYALVLVYADGTDGGLIINSVINALSNLQIDNLIFPDVADITVVANQTAALEIKDSAGTYINVDTTTIDAGPPVVGPIVSLKTINVVTGDGAEASVIKSSGDHNLTLLTGNAVSGGITITDGTAGAIRLTTETSGKVIVGSRVKTATITGITKGSTTVVIGTNTFVAGEVVKIVGVVDSVGSDGDLATALNGNTFTLSAVDAGGANFTLIYDSSGLSDTWSSGGTATSADDATITTTGTNDLVLNTNTGTNSGFIRINEGEDHNIEIRPAGTGSLLVGPGDGPGQIVSVGAYDLRLIADDSGTGAVVAVGKGVNGKITLTPEGTGGVVVAAGLKTPGISVSTAFGAITDITKSATDADPTVVTIDTIDPPWTALQKVSISGISTGMTQANGGPYTILSRTNSALTLDLDSSTFTAYDEAGLGAVSLSAYVNFGGTAGDSGFGLRNSGGVVEVKNSGGAWSSSVGMPSGTANYFQSEAYGIADNAADVQEHGLSSEPLLVVGYFECIDVDGDNNYSLGDKVNCSTSSNAENSRALSLWWDDTNIGMRVRARVLLVNKTSNIGFRPDPGEWVYKVRAWV